MVLEQLLQVVLGIDARENRHREVHVAEHLARKVLGLESAGQGDQSDIELRQGGQVAHLVQRAVDADVGQALALDQLLEPGYLASLAEDQEMDVLLVAEPLRQPNDVVHVLGHANVAAVEEHDLPIQAQLPTEVRLRQLPVGRGRPVVEHLESVAIGESLLFEVMQVGRRLHADDIGRLVLLELLPAEVPVGQAPLAQDVGVHGPLREDVAQDEVGTAAPELLETAHQPAEEDRRRVVHHQIAGGVSEEVPPLSPHHRRQASLVDRANQHPGPLDAAGADAQDLNAVLLGDPSGEGK